MAASALSIIRTAAILYLAFTLLFTLVAGLRATIAFFMGDRELQEEGYVTLNPMAHIDLIGTGALALLFSATQAGLISVPLAYLIFLIASMLFGMRLFSFCPLRANRYTWLRTGLFFSALAVPLGAFIVAYLSLLTMMYAAAYISDPVLVTILREVCGTIRVSAVFFATFSLFPIFPLEGASIFLSLTGLWGSSFHEFLEEHQFIIYTSFLFLLLTAFYAPLPAPFNFVGLMFDRVRTLLEYGLYYLIA